ncbi:L-threonylcarbamoyladenylate synthase [Streptococcus equinus]|uniref:L-threonylcarbamoyladenylate synthase n=1 Tax=Streptococcus equinus TaxID=1335 RepID=A0A1H0MQC1_STREI|nr:L-threonylcarbamoyladenylate synthase [Streptococcus equinus]SDO82340.1 L-threonylcarbamoyladenylate synthase [Streptococcus equinus]
MANLEEILQTGGAVILPTETVYGLFAQAMNEEAVEHVYHLKRRPKDKAMNLNVADYETILAFSKNQPTYLKKLYDAFLPGPLTIILQANDRVPAWINSGLSTIGFRIPKHPQTLALIKKVGPLIGPSANISGQESGKVFTEIKEQFESSVSGLSDDAAITGVDSTILDLSGDFARILRQGAITKEALLARVPELPFAKD